VKSLAEAVIKITTNFPARDSQTTKSKSIQTNHFLLHIDNATELYEYEVFGFPVNTNRTRQRKLFSDALALVPFLQHNAAKYAADELKTVISWEPLHANITVTQDENGSEGTTWGPFQVPDGKVIVATGVPNYVQVSIRFVRKLGMQGLHDYCAGQGTPRLWDSSPEVKALNLSIS
jgi:hypothetical protein